MLTDQVGVVPQARAQPLDRHQVRIGLDPLSEELDQWLEAGDVEALLAAEVLEDEAVGDARGIRHLVDGDLVVVPLAEDLEGRLDQLPTPLAGPLGCQRTCGDGPG